jgi:hypothetical protein
MIWEHTAQPTVRPPLLATEKRHTGKRMRHDSSPTPDCQITMCGYARYVEGILQGVVFRRRAAVMVIKRLICAALLLVCSGVAADQSTSSGAISSSSDGKKIWARAAWEGAIVYAGAVLSPNWGIVTDITGESDSMDFDIDWKAGPGPVAGSQLYVPRLHDVTVRTSQIAPSLSWNDTDAARQITPAGSRSFPENYPAGMSGL